jgi:hypothetical protein
LYPFFFAAVTCHQGPTIQSQSKTQSEAASDAGSSRITAANTFCEVANFRRTHVLMKKALRSMCSQNQRTIWRVLYQEDLGCPRQIRYPIKRLDPRPLNSAVGLGNNLAHVFLVNDGGEEELEVPARLVVRILELSNENLRL